jgi:putative DNA primase/helicase
MLAKIKTKKPDPSWLTHRALHDWANTFEDLYMDRQTQYGTQFELSDAGFACRFAWNNGCRIRYHVGLQSLGIWNGHKWDFSEEAQTMIYERAVKSARAIKHELEDLSKDRRAKVGKVLLNHASASENRIPQMLKSAENLLMTKAEAFDADPYLLNCANGIVDLRTKKIVYHDEDRDYCLNAMCTKSCAVDYNPWAISERWEEFLTWFCSENEVAETFLQRLLGYASCLGINPQEIIIALKGPTASGKTTLLEAIKSVLGDYAKTASPETFLKQTFTGASKARSDLSRLVDARLVTVPEMPKGKPLDTSLLKGMSGGSSLTVRTMYKIEQEGRFPCTLILEGNDWPKVDNNELPMWRRLIPFEVFQSLKPDEVKPEIKQHFLEDKNAREAILAWLIEGVYQYGQQGLAIPASVKQMVQTYKAEMNPLKEFLDGHFKYGPDFNVAVWAVNEKYKEYCREHHLIPVSPQQFNKELAQRGCQPKQRNNVRGWQGLKGI